MNLKRWTTMLSSLVEDSLDRIASGVPLHSTNYGATSAVSGTPSILTVTRQRSFVDNSVALASSWRRSDVGSFVR